MTVLDVFAAYPTVFVVSCALVGLLVGSFLNVVIYRVPVMLDRQWQAQCAELAGKVAEVQPAFNLIVPGSSCPSCRKPIRAWQNVPVLSWVFLKGRCAACNARISGRYPVVEALTGLLSAVVAWKYGLGWPTLAALVLTWFLVALTFIDVDHQLLPDNMTLPLLWMGLLLSLWGPQGGGAPIPVDLRSSVIGAIAGYVSLWSVFHLFRLATGKEGMGYGDFKLFAALGAWLGWKMLMPIILMAAVVGAVVGIAMLSFQHRSRSTPIPFGPFLAAAGWIMLIYGPQILDSYFGFSGLRP